MLRPHFPDFTTDQASAHCATSSRVVSHSEENIIIAIYATASWTLSLPHERWTLSLPHENTTNFCSVNIFEGPINSTNLGLLFKIPTVPGRQSSGYWAQFNQHQACASTSIKKLNSTLDLLKSIVVLSIMWTASFQTCIYCTWLYHTFALYFR